MKFNGKSLTLTISLLFVLFLVIFVEISLFISGPSLRYDDKVSRQKASIQETYENIETIQRHVFSYIIYSGNDQETRYWFNENGELLTKRAMTSLHEDQALAKVKESYGIDDASVSYGYGYDAPVYVIENEQMEVLLDVDSLKQVFYRKKG